MHHEDREFDHYRNLSAADYRAIREAPSILEARAALDTRVFGLNFWAPHRPDSEMWPGMFEGDAV